MKKIFTALLCATMVLGITGCGDKSFKVSIEDITLNVGDKQELSFKIDPEDAYDSKKDSTCVIEDTEIASFEDDNDSTSYVIGISGGKTKYHCTHDGVDSNSATITVKGKTKAELEKEKAEKEEAEKKAAEEKAKAEEAERKANEKPNFINSCGTVDYTEIYRNAESHIGGNAKFTGKVVQVQDVTGGTVLRVNVTPDAYGYYDDTIYVEWTNSDKANDPDAVNRVLDDDIITIYGTLGGTKTYESTMGASITIPMVFAKYITLN